MGVPAAILEPQRLKTLDIHADSNAGSIIAAIHAVCSAQGRPAPRDIDPTAQGEQA
ncbi:MAG: hypothetical protein AAGI15_14290 [Pseudomonadota bacterium]